MTRRADRTPWWQIGGPLPDLSAVVRRLRRRRHRRPAGHHRPPRPPRLAGGRRHLAEPDHRLAQRRLGLRRGRLLRRAARSGHDGGSSTAWWPRRPRRGIRVLMDLVPNHTSDRAPVVRRLPLARGRRPRRDWYVWADPGPDGAPPNNWVSSFGGPAWTLDPHDRPVLPPQPPVRATGPQLVERRGPRRLRRRSSGSGSTGAWPGSGSTCATSSSRTPSCATTRRRPRTTTSRRSSSGSGPSTTATGPRSTTSSGAGGGWPTPTTRPGSSSGRPR